MVLKLHDNIGHRILNGAIEIQQESNQSDKIFEFLG